MPRRTLNVARKIVFPKTDTQHIHSLNRKMEKVTSSVVRLQQKCHRVATDVDQLNSFRRATTTCLNDVEKHKQETEDRFVGMIVGAIVVTVFSVPFLARGRYF